MKNYPTNKIRNITLMGHGSVGKTSLIEAALFHAKAIDRMGKTQDGNTVCDFDSEEMRRGISTNTSVAALEWQGHKYNFIDTPGDFDFLAEQMQGLKVGDLALVVVSAKDGLAVGAEKAFRLASKKAKPLALFVNRLDEAHANFAKTVDVFREAYGTKVVPLTMPIMENGEFVGIINVLKLKAYKFADKGQLVDTEIPAALEAEIDKYNNALQEQIAEADEELMMKFFEGEEFTVEERNDGIGKAILSGSLIPVFAGSAAKNQGVGTFMELAARFFPNPLEVPALLAYDKAGELVEIKCNENEPMLAFVFKTIVDPFVGRISLFRVYAGVFDSSNPYNPTYEKEERINGVFLMQGKKQINVDGIKAGDIGAVAKLVDTKTNETLCSPDRILKIDPVSLPSPCITLAISPEVRGEEDKIMQGMNRLRDEDLAFDIVNDPETHQLLISGLGEVQLDVLKSKLKAKYGVKAILSEAKVAYRETIRKKVKVQGRHKKQSGGHGQYGDVWIEFEPGETEELTFEEKIFGGSVPKNFHPAVEKGLNEAIEKGVLAGFPVVNLKATLVDGSYHDVDSSEMSFKLAARLAYRNGLPKADPILLEPIYAVKVHIPDEYLGDIMGDMSKRRGRILGMGADSDQGYQVVEAEAPLSELAKYATDLKSMTQGRGWFTIKFVRYEATPADVSAKVIAEANPEE